MNKFLTTVLLGVALIFGVATAQEYLDRQPYPEERRFLSGAKHEAGLEHDRQHYVVQHTAGDAYYLKSNLNVGVLLVRTNGSTHIDFPNPTNSRYRSFTIMNHGDGTCTLSNSLGPSFETTTNLVTSLLVMRSNTVARVFSTGTNWYAFFLKD